MDLTLSQILISSIILITLMMFKLVDLFWFRPKKLEKFLRKQGFNGNPYKFLHGDLKDYESANALTRIRSIQLSDDIIPHIYPYFSHLIKIYGKNFIIWFGPFPVVNISDPEHIKEIFRKHDSFKKPLSNRFIKSLSSGIIFLEGQKWAKRRKIVRPAFRQQKIKSMVPRIVVHCIDMIQKLKALIRSSGGGSCEIDIWPYLQDLCRLVISEAVFGKEGEEKRRIIQRLGEEKVRLARQFLASSLIPGWRFLPTEGNKRMKANTREIQSVIGGIIDQRQKAMEKGQKYNDSLLETILMQTSIEGPHNRMSSDDIIQECHFFHLAGSDPTSTLLVWTMVLLSKYPEWQTLAREEVFRVFGKSSFPNFDGLTHLKTINMILLEVLRLYPPVSMIFRSPSKSVTIGDVTIPHGAHIVMLPALLHQDPDIWGDDAKEFKPQRFSNGTLNATKSLMYSFIPFGAGPRTCVGQNFSMIEAKITLSMILQQFSFELSASYLHSPHRSLVTLRPQHGAPFIFQELGL